MNSNNNIILFLTCCVDPKGMSYTVLNNKEIRKNQYYEAIDFYLLNTPFKILIVENTLFNIDAKFLENERIEYLTFDGNDFDKSLGKGYGEAIIIEYGLKHSKFLRQRSSGEQFIVKVTGRLQILSLDKHLRQLYKIGKKNIVVADASWKGNFIYSHFFISSFDFLSKYFLPHKEEINDTKGIYFENALFTSIMEYIDANNFFRVFSDKLLVEGVSGSNGSIFSNRMNFMIYFKQIFKSLALRFYFKVRSLYN